LRHVHLGDDAAVLLPAAAVRDEDYLERTQADRQLARSDVRVDVQGAALGAAAQRREDGDVAAQQRRFDRVRVHGVDFSDEAKAWVVHLRSEDARLALRDGQPGGAERCSKVVVRTLKDSDCDSHCRGVGNAVAANVLGFHASLGKFCAHARRFYPCAVSTMVRP